MEHLLKVVAVERQDMLEMVAMLFPQAALGLRHLRAAAADRADRQLTNQAVAVELG
jgi:hypothetical protein